MKDTNIIYNVGETYNHYYYLSFKLIVFRDILKHVLKREISEKGIKIYFLKSKENGGYYLNPYPAGTESDRSLPPV